VAPKRVFVEAGVYDAFVAALSRRVTELHASGRRDGSADVGPLVRRTQRTLIAGQYDDAVTRGASVAARSRFENDMQPGTEPANGAFFAPALLTDVPDDARALTEETFGPVLPVIRVRDEHDAIARANAASFGLSASVWSRNHRRALGVAAQLQCGSVMINDAASIAGMADVPHGGVKASGTGRTHGAQGIEECTRIKATVDDRFTGWRQPWWFGYTPETMGDLDGFARAAHGRTIRERLRGLWPMLRLLFAPRRPL
jgi:succinate-semialdehyde dehydrogenase/glutarate-semialdehyde dehydrogenase